MWLDYLGPHDHPWLRMLLAEFERFFWWHLSEAVRSHGLEPALLPKEPLARAHVRSLALIVACEIHPVNNPRVLKYVKNTLGHSQDEVDTWYRHWIADGLAKLEAELCRPGTGRHCQDDTPSMADCCLVPQIFNAQRFQCDLSPFPTVMRVFDA